MATATNEKSVIGKSISKVANKHKPYFVADENGIITSYNRKVCVDRVELKAKLDKDTLSNLLIRLIGQYQLKEVVTTLKNGFVRKLFQFDLSKSDGVFIEIIPHEKTNLKIQLQSKFTNNNRGNSPEMLAILNEYPLFITRLDIATDYTTSFNTSAYLRRNGNQKQTNYDTSSWSGSTSNPNKTACDSHYDRKAKDESTDSNFTNRFEVKLFFKEADSMTFANLNHALIVQRLQKEMFIPCLTYSYFHEKQVKTNRGDKAYIDLISQAKKAQNENAIKLLLTKSQWNTFRKHFKACRDDIEQAYLESSHIIYDFLLPIAV